MIRTSVQLDIKYVPEQLNNVPIQDVAFFDIETTGFSPNNTHLYMIGMAHITDGIWYLDQWFAENKGEEIIIIREFFDAIADSKLMVSYNGLGFDTSYIREKCKIYEAECILDKLKHLDIYRQIFPYKKFFKLQNYKQKNIERFLGIHREDIYSGKDLIKAYEKYVSSPDEETKRILLLHNADDIKGLISILPILNYIDFFKGAFSVNEIDIQTNTAGQATIGMYALFELIPDKNLPKHISQGLGPFYMSGHDSKVTFKIKMNLNNLKFFYSDYKDYYYLPKEDMAIHKSVAFYVDKDFRIQAKAANCYSKKTGRFLPQFTNIIEPYFKEEYHDSVTYFELTQELCENTELIKKYLLHCINHLK